MVAKAALAESGPQILHVGERSPKDKKYETSEVVLAAPGTVVAPIPKGMKVDENNSLMLIIMQILKALQGGGAGGGGDMMNGGGVPPGAPMAGPMAGAANGTFIDPFETPGRSGSIAAPVSPLAQALANITSISGGGGGGGAGSISVPGAAPAGGGVSLSGVTALPTSYAAPAPGAANAGGTMRPMKKGGVVGVRGMKRAATGTSVTAANNPYDTTNLANAFASTLANYNLGTGRLNLDTRVANQNYNMGQQSMQNDLYQMNRNQAFQRVMNQPAPAGSDYASQQYAAQQDAIARSNAQNAQAAAQRDAMNQQAADAQRLAMQQQAMNNDYALGQEANRLRAQEIQNALNIAMGQQALQSKDDEFRRIMMGVSEASVGGGGIPTTSVFG